MIEPRQITNAPHGHILTNIAVWSPDSRRIVYDVRSDPAGEVFDGDRIAMVDADTGDVRVLFESGRGEKCGVATHHPSDDCVVFILGQHDPVRDIYYGPTLRQGVLVNYATGERRNLDARDVSPPFTPGALRGGSHVHVFSPDGQRVSFTYEDHVLNRFTQESAGQEINLRNVGVCVPGPVRVPRTNPRNHDGEFFSVLVSRTIAKPQPGTDDIAKAFEDAWIGPSGAAIAFQGLVANHEGKLVSELFIAELPADLTRAGPEKIEGTDRFRPRPPTGVVQRRLTHTLDRRHPGLQGPRHWPRSSPDGKRIAFLMRDDDGVVQLWTITPTGADQKQLTRNKHDIASAFSWRPDGSAIAHVMDGSVCLTNADTGATARLMAKRDVRPEACVVSPDGERIAFVMPVTSEEGTFNQIHTLAIPSS